MPELGLPFSVLLSVVVKVGLIGLQGRLVVFLGPFDCELPFALFGELLLFLLLGQALLFGFLGEFRGQFELAGLLLGFGQADLLLLLLLLGQFADP